MNDISIFDGTEKLRIAKPLRLIELFAGYGSQALALKYLGIPYEHYRISEWATKSIQAYKDMHYPNANQPYDTVFSDKEVKSWLKGRISSDYSTPLTDEQIDRMPIAQARTIFRNMFATNNLGSICSVQARDIRLDDKHTYLLSYSFPCQDLSMAGLRQGMERGSSTRSGLLWEVERLLNEWGEIGQGPDILLMDHVSNLKWVTYRENARNPKTYERLAAIGKIKIQSMNVKRAKTRLKKVIVRWADGTERLFPSVKDAAAAIGMSYPYLVCVLKSTGVTHNCHVRYAQ